MHRVSSVLNQMKRLEADIQDYRTVVLWLDFYSQLLTARTREVLELHYNEDMTLSEIAEHLAITRQGVHDKFRQGLQQLMDYEAKLGLVQRFLTQKEQIAQVIADLDQGQAEKARSTLVRLHQSLG